MNEPPRIAIFEAYWRLHSNTAYSALALAKAGFHVDVFQYCVDSAIVGQPLTEAENIAVHCFGDQECVGDEEPLSANKSFSERPKSRKHAHRFILILLRRVIRACYNLFFLLVYPEFGLLPRDIRERALQIMQPHKYKAVIGVEKGGLLWAGQIAQRKQIPLIYFSLELYTRDHPFCAGVLGKRFKAGEEKYHKRCWATIVQDIRRGKVLLTDNDIRSNMKLLYVPISRSGGPILSRSRWMQDTLNIGNNEVVILVHGKISERRLSVELAKVAQRFRKHWKLVFHGWGSTAVIDRIRELDCNNRICLSLNLLPASQEAEVVCSSHIGLVLYDKETTNDRLTAFSSEKMALYLQCGIPVVAFASEGYEHITQDNVGVLINTLKELPVAIEQILDDYQGYRSRAFLCYQKFYVFERNFAPVLEALSETQLGHSVALEERARTEVKAEVAG
jgi:glycosyltransferase involved in cell wall biosynthesis